MLRIWPKNLIKWEAALLLSSMTMVLISLLFFHAGSAIASGQSSLLSSSALNAKEHDKATRENDSLSLTKGLIMLDYEVIAVKDRSSLDLLGIHYLQQLNEWLYFGVGAHAPTFEGDYGGFMVFDATIHAQRKIFRNFFIDAGFSFGGGGGGSSVEQSKELTGDGGYIKKYIGLGYDFDSLSAGLNYSHVRFTNSPIDDSQLNAFIQIPLSFSVGSYKDSGKKVAPDYFLSERRESIFSLELNNIFQIEPEGKIKDTINTGMLQYSHFLTEKRYLFFELDVGYNGLPLYNQVVGGIGYRQSVSPRVNLYGQLGVGSGGYSPELIDTGPGFLLYPKVSVEYLLNNTIGLSLSGGYLYAPKASSKNYTLGAAINYHFSKGKKKRPGYSDTDDQVFQGIRFSLFQQTLFHVRVAEEKHHNINMVSCQLDFDLNSNWYIPIQASVAYNDFIGYPGYGELLTGIGIQNEYKESKPLHYFFQALIGTNVNNALLQPSIGINYSINNKYAIYGQVAKKISINNHTVPPYEMQLNSYSIGLGMTYRFSLAR